MKKVSLFFSVFISLFILISCGNNNDEEDKGDEITPFDKTVLDLSKVQIKESESQAYNSTFEVIMTNNNDKYKVNLKTRIYNYNKLIAGQSIKDSIDVISISVNDGEAFETALMDGDVKVESITNDKLTLVYSNLSLVQKANTRNLEILIIINGKIIYNKDKLSKEFTIDEKKAEVGSMYNEESVGDMIIMSPSSNDFTDFQAIVNGDKFYTGLKKHTNQYLIKGDVINYIIDYIYTGRGDFFIKKGKVVLYDITEKTAQLYFDNVLLVCNNQEMVADGILKFKSRF